MDKTNSNASKCSSKSWSHNRTTDAEIIEKKGSQKGKGNARSPGNTDLSNLKIEAPSAVCSPHLKYGIFNQKKITVNPRSVERPKSPMKQRFSSADMDNKDTVSEPGSPFFSIRALSEQDRDKFTPLQAKGGDMAARLLPAKP
ncbi:PREDICTED: uncharacterized protein LOC106106636 isoform X2 [Papilio polytes]|uniref:uncharacterized protein LOC106106636 isoform X2 n=1 Tax=Papilio polytes TaxID=76194 RepID=UPI0006768609|nr:PREDICTED: uncharacterized protein LOC106106636 isoform X2 [Papilio polytes]